MRFVLYNIRYGTGGKKIHFPLNGYLRHTGKNFERITQFLQDLKPDVAGLVEVDAGSYRSGKMNQAETIADRLGHYHVYRSKYGENSLTRHFPLLNQQGNAFVVRDGEHKETFHYFDRGAKKLVIELEMETVSFFLIHLALSSRLRHRQLGDLYDLLKTVKKPHIIAGDFNALWGEQEIRLFQAATGLVNAHAANSPTFPSWKPKRHLDFILHSPDISVERCWMPNVLFSDHLPIVCDFTVH
ncbi:MAG: endonuclease/exonuclease/phosphatase family protein [Kiritimatiellales bacterium]|nr:endonuclease/exonuclease/phosphatase family protein [Kiritimatiellales bacterium]